MKTAPQGVSMTRIILGREVLLSISAAPQLWKDFSTVSDAEFILSKVKAAFADFSGEFFDDDPKQVKFNYTEDSPHRYGLHGVCTDPRTNKRVFLDCMVGDMFDRYPVGHESSLEVNLMADAGDEITEIYPGVVAIAELKWV